VILDSHTHLWKLARGDYHWLASAPRILVRDYLAEDLQPLLHESGVNHTILVQAAPTEAETQFLLESADQNNFVAGVTGWLDLAEPHFPERLARYRRNRKFVAVRPMLQDLPEDDWIVKPAVLRNLKHLEESGFAFEFLTFPRHLPWVLQALETVPQLRAVIDHLSKPPIAAGSLEPWGTLIRKVAEFPNVFCKLSGVVTEAAPRACTAELLTPYVDHVVKVFGVDRVMFGSDWPVCRVAAEYQQVIDLLRSILARHLGQASLDKVFHLNAARFFRVEGLR